jgi:hypothetical protein
LQSAAAVLSASLLGVGVAYCACVLLIPVVAREESGASLVSADGRPPDVVCSSGNASELLPTVRADD